MLLACRAQCARRTPQVEWSPYSIKITGPAAFGQPLKAIDHDCNDIPDAAMTIAVAALFAEVRRQGPCHLHACDVVHACMRRRWCACMHAFLHVHQLPVRWRALVVVLLHSTLLTTPRMLMLAALCPAALRLFHARHPRRHHHRQGTTAIRNVYNWRVKETERMVAIVTELGKLGATVEEGRDYCVITPPKELKANVAIDTYDDHRMAMAFSLAACGDVPVIINDPGCTRKTFPTYFDVLESVVEYK